VDLQRARIDRQEMDMEIQRLRQASCSSSSGSSGSSGGGGGGDSGSHGSGSVAGAKRIRYERVFE